MKAILFDFDGTIADTMPEIYSILQNISGEFGYSPVSEREAKTMRDLSIPQILKKLHFPFWKFPFLIKRTKEELAKKISGIKPVKNMPSVILALQKKGYRLGIITSNKKESVEVFFKKNNMNAFDFIYTGSSLFGKERKISRAMKQYGLLPKDTMYVGDEVRDIEAAKKLGIQVVAVTWGFNNKKALEHYNPDYLIDKPNELLKVFV